jgi:predicted nucleotide-binding protein
MEKNRRLPAARTRHEPTLSRELALNRLQRFLDEIPEIRSAGRRSPNLQAWEKNVRIVLGDFYGENSVTSQEFRRIWYEPGQHYPGQPQAEYVTAFERGLDQAASFLEARVRDLGEEIAHDAPRAAAASAPAEFTSRRVFVVHGHDHGNKETIARFLGKLDLEPIILHEQADEGRTIIEKFEAHSADVYCAVVILTADDVAASRASPEQREFRARQNVILELGFFVGRLGRNRTIALVEKGVSLPSDIHGIIYIPIGEADWQIRLVKELKAAGLDVDANRAF